MTGYLLWGQNRFLDRTQCGYFCQLRYLHVLQALRVLSQSNVAHTPLDVVNEPSLAKYWDNRDALARNVAAVFENLRAGHDVLVHHLLFDALLPDLNSANSREHFF